LYQGVSVRLLSRHWRYGTRRGGGAGGRACRVDHIYSGYLGGPQQEMLLIHVGYNGCVTEPPQVSTKHSIIYYLLSHLRYRQSTVLYTTYWATAGINKAQYYILPTETYEGVKGLIRALTTLECPKMYEIKMKPNVLLRRFGWLEKHALPSDYSSFHNLVLYIV